MPAPIGFCVAMLLCYLAGHKHRCLCAGLCHPPTQLEKVQRTHHCISEVWSPKVEASLLMRGESSKGIPNIWITLGEEIAHSSSSSRFFTPLPPLLFLPPFPQPVLLVVFGVFSGGGGFQPKCFWMEHRLLTVLSKRNPQKRNRKAQQQTPKLRLQLEQKQMD